MPLKRLLIQRRARYFLFVPWIFQDAERRSTRANGPLRLSAKMERQLIDVLLAGDDTDGVIGARARGGLRQLPSMIYWSGLAAWGIRTRKGTREQWARLAVRQTSAGDAATDDGDRVGAQCPGGTTISMSHPTTSPPRRRWSYALPEFRS